MVNPVLARFAYESQSTPGMDSRRMVQLLREAWSKNLRLQITGALDFRNGRFAQVIEGHPRDIAKIVSRILCDPRHTQIAVTEYRISDSRQYSTWTVCGFEEFWADQPPIPELRYSRDNIIVREVFARRREPVRQMRGPWHQGLHQQGEG